MFVLDNFLVGKKYILKYLNLVEMKRSKISFYAKTRGVIITFL